MPNGSIRRECLDRLIVIGERHLRRIPASYFHDYDRSRSHLSQGKDSPVPPAGQERQSRQDHRPSTGWRTPPSLRSTGRLNGGLTTADSNHIAPLAGSVSCGRQARTCRTDCRMAACRRRPLLSCHRICSSPSTRGHKIRIVSAQFEFLGGTGAILHRRVRTKRPPRLLLLCSADNSRILEETIRQSYRFPESGNRYSSED